MALTFAAHKKPRTLDRVSQRRQKIITGIDQQVALPRSSTARGDFRHIFTRRPTGFQCVSLMERRISRDFV